MWVHRISQDRLGPQSIFLLVSQEAGNGWVLAGSSDEAHRQAYQPLWRHWVKQMCRKRGLLGDGSSEGGHRRRNIENAVIQAFTPEPPCAAG